MITLKPFPSMGQGTSYATSLGDRTWLWEVQMTFTVNMAAVSLSSARALPLSTPHTSFLPVCVQVGISGAHHSGVLKRFQILVERSGCLGRRHPGKLG